MKSIFIGQGFEWVDFRDVDGSTHFIHPPAAELAGRSCLFVCNFTPVPRLHYRVGVPDPGVYREIFNSDSEMFGGSNLGNARRGDVGAGLATTTTTTAFRLRCRRWRWWCLNRQGNGAIRCVGVVRRNRVARAVF